MPSNRKPAIAAIVGAVVLLLAIAGLNFAGYINLPFLPKSPELVLLRAIDDVANDGTFDVVAIADTDAELSVEALGQEAKGGIRLDATAKGTAHDFDADDLSKLTIADGSFAADFTLSYDVAFLEGETGSLHTAGTFDLAFGEGAINYVLQEPLHYGGVIQFDPQGLVGETEPLGEQKKTTVRSLDASEIENMKMEGDTITFTVNTASLDTSLAREVLGEILKPTGIEIKSAKTNLSDLDVSVDLGTTGSVRAHVTGAMDMDAQGERGIDLPSVLPVVPVDVELKLNVPIDIELVIS